jgi:hypothetical protein
MKNKKATRKKQEKFRKNIHKLKQIKNREAKATANGHNHNFDNIFDVAAAPDLFIKKLKYFNKKTTVAQIASLLTLPKFLANNNRLHLLAHLAILHCNGSNVATVSEIMQWLNDDLAGSTAFFDEDPVEDVFIGNISFFDGNKRIFLGRWNSSDFYLQQILDATFLGCPPPNSQVLLKEVNQLLSISEAIAEKCGLVRWCIGAGIDRGIINIESTEIQNGIDKVTFTNKELKELTIEKELLFPFRLDNGVKNIKSPKPTQILLISENSLIVCIPDAISPAIRTHIISWLKSKNFIAAFNERLRILQRQLVFEDLVGFMDCQKLSADINIHKPECLNNIDDLMFKFDSDKFAHVILINDSLIDVNKTGVFGIREETESYKDTLKNYCGKICQYLMDLSNGNKGLTVFINGGIGRGYSLLTPQFPESWDCICFDIGDFFCLAHSREISFLKLWKLKTQQKKLNQKGIEFFDPAGALNTYAFWRKQQGGFIPVDVAFPGITDLVLISDFVAEIREEARSDYDVHSTMISRPMRYVVVKRTMPHSHFESQRKAPIYGSVSALSMGELHAAIETKRGPYWLIYRQRVQDHDQQKIAFQIWEALSLWMNDLCPYLDEYFMPLGQRPLHIEIYFENLDKWVCDFNQLDYEGALPDIEVDANDLWITIKIPENFSSFMYQKTNWGERVLIDRIISGSSELLRMVGFLGISDLEINNLLDRIFSNPSAKRIHLFSAKTHFDYLDSTLPTQKEIRFIQEEDIAFLNLGIAWKVITQREKYHIAGKQKCLKLLNTLVETLWVDIRAILHKCDREAVLISMLSNIESIHKDRSHWRRSALALSTLNDSKIESEGIAQERESTRTRTKLANRALLEMIICGKSTAEINDSKSIFDDLSARIITMIELAQVSDAIKYGLIDDQLNILPNGSLKIDDSAMKAIVLPYAREMFSGQFQEAANSYSKLYSDETKEDKIKADFSPEFKSAFWAEYNISTDNFIEATAELLDIAAEKKLSVIKLDYDELKNTLMINRKLSEKEVDNFLESFSLKQRENWDIVPDGFISRDFYPWKYQRRLSLNKRPLIFLESQDKKILFYGVRQLHQSAGYILDSIEKGWLPQEACSSAEMKAFLGEMTNKKGEFFEDLVEERIKKLGWLTRKRVQMKIFGAPEEFGEIDVLAWHTLEQRLLLIECKRLKPALTVGEIGEQLKDFSGNDDDNLVRHLRRVKWITENIKSVGASFETDLTQHELQSFIVTSNIVPMKFKNSLPIANEDIIELSQLEFRICSGQMIH